MKLSLKTKNGKSVQAAIKTIASYLSEANIAEVAGLWPTLPDATRERIRQVAPTFAAVLDLGQRIP